MIGYVSIGIYSNNMYLVISINDFCVVVYSIKVSYIGIVKFCNNVIWFCIGG